MNRPATAAAGPGRIGRYALLERIGKGAMGVVYSARDEMMDRVVAVKVMMTDLEGDPDTRTRFYREAQAAGRLLHPNIITIFDMGEEEGHIYMVMELLKGETLSEFLRRPAVTIEQKVSVMVQVCDGLGAAHANGIVHRDVKPGNLFVLQDGTLKILDFGVARLASSTMTASGFIIGTPDYMSPEQARGKEVDARSDIFSAAAVFYYMLVGRKPFAAPDLPSVLRKVQHEDPPPIGDADAPPALARVIMRSLTKDPASRHQSMADFVADLAKFRRCYDGETRQIAAAARDRYDAIQALVKERSELAERLGLPWSDDDPPASRRLREEHPAFVARARDLLLVPFSRLQASEVAGSLAAEFWPLEREVAGLREADTAIAQAERSLQEGRPEEAAETLQQAAPSLPDTARVREVRSRCAEAVADYRARLARLQVVVADARAAAKGENWVAVAALCEDGLALDPGSSELVSLRIRAREAIGRAARERVRAQQRSLDRARRAIVERRLDAAEKELQQARELETPAGETEPLERLLAEARRAAAAEAAVAERAADTITAARLDFQSGRRGEAIARLQALLDAEPGAPSVHHELDLLKEEQRRIVEAERRRIEAERRRAEADQHAARAAEAVRAGDAAAAQREAAAALALEPSHGEAVRLHAAAQAELRAAADAEQRRARAAGHLARARSLTESGALAKASREAQRVFAYEPDSGDAAALLDEINRRQTADAIARDRARQIQQEVKAAQSSLRAGRYDLAESAARRAVAIDDADASARALLEEAAAARRNDERLRREKEDDTVASPPPVDADDTVAFASEPATTVNRLLARIAAAFRGLLGGS